MKTDHPIITSRKNPLVMETAALHEKKHRNKSRSFLIEGEKLVTEAADIGLPFLRVFVAESRSADFFREIAPRFSSPMYEALPIYILNDDCFSKISSEKAPQGVIGVLKHLDFFERMTIIYDEDIFELREKRLLILSGIQDPGNLGAIIRSAVAFGTEVIFLSEDCADLYNSKTVRAAMGSLFRIRTVVVEDMASLVSALRHDGCRVLAAELRPGAVALGEAALTARDVIVIGNEGHGIPPHLSSLCDASVYLPISKDAESLNAAVAASVFLWEQGKSK